jgi:hypothetical protein
MVGFSYLGIVDDKFSLGVTGLGRGGGAGIRLLYFEFSTMLTRPQEVNFYFYL